MDPIRPLICLATVFTSPKFPLALPIPKVSGLCLPRAGIFLIGEILLGQFFFKFNRKSLGLNPLQLYFRALSCSGIRNAHSFQLLSGI